MGLLASVWPRLHLLLHKVAPKFAVSKLTVVLGPKNHEFRWITVSLCHALLKNAILLGYILQHKLELLSCRLLYEYKKKLS